MEYFGNIYASIGLLIIVSFITYKILFRIKAGEKELTRLDLTWQISLILGIVFATIDVRIYMNTWKYNQNQNYTEVWYDVLTKDLIQYKKFNKVDYSRAKYFGSSDTTDHIKAVNWYTTNIENLQSSRTAVVKNQDLETWGNIHKEINNFINTNNESILSFYEYVKLYSQNVDEGINKASKNKKLSKRTNFELFIFAIYPFILSFCLALLIAKSLYLLKKYKT